MSGPEPEIRIATPDDAPALRDAFGDARPFRRLFEGDPQVVIVLAADDGAPGAALAVETSGHPIHGEWAWVSATFGDEGPASAMYEAAAEALGGGSATALAVPVDVGDRAAARRLEASGFKPSGGAYRPIGPGMVEYLDGYADPQGFQVDFVRELG